MATIMERKIMAKKLQKEDERVKKLMIAMDVGPPKVPKGGVLERKLKEKAKARKENENLVLSMVAKKRKRKEVKKPEVKKPKKENNMMKVIRLDKDKPKKKLYGARFYTDEIVKKQPELRKYLTKGGLFNKRFMSKVEVATFRTPEYKLYKKYVVATTPN